MYLIELLIENINIVFFNIKYKNDSKITRFIKYFVFFVINDSQISFYELNESVIQFDS